MSLVHSAEVDRASVIHLDLVEPDRIVRMLSIPALDKDFDPGPRPDLG